MADLDLPALADHYRITAARLRRVNEALSKYDELDCSAAMPAELRPKRLPQQPTVSRPALKELQQMLGQRLVELDTLRRAYAVGRRN